MSVRTPSSPCPAPPVPPLSPPPSACPAPEDGPDAPGVPAARSGRPPADVAPTEPGTAFGPGREALRAARSRALAELAGHHLAERRTLLLWLGTALLVVGWLLAVPGVGYLADGDVFGAAAGGGCLLLAGALAAPSALALGQAAREDLRARAELRRWALLDRDPDRRAHWYVPRQARLLVLSALAVCGGGLALGLTAALSGPPGVLSFPAALGLGAVLAVMGGAGLLKAADFYRLVIRELGPPARPRGGAHR
ncbi:hypothetical protein [Streptomyces pactum]|uniref:hypothetical protein n=1 Tax=Streptomyces pactum TaxID=68249 RepID=UPI0036F8FFA8